jgi:hypothetical protein
MRPLILSFFSIAAFATGCSTAGSAGSEGGVDLSFGDAGPFAATYTPPAGAAITGEFSTTGNFEGQYTLSTQVPMGSPLASCVLSIDGAAPTIVSSGTGPITSSASVDDSTGQVHTLSVQVGPSSAFQGQAVCTVKAANVAKPNVGDSIDIVIVETSADGG